MSLPKLFLLNVIAMLLAGALASIPASADTCTGGSHLVFCNDNQEPLVGASALAIGGLALMAGHLGGVEVKFDCKEVTSFNITLEKLGAARGLVHLQNCKELKPAKCKLSAAQEVKIEASFTIQQESTTLATFAGADPGEEFTTLIIENDPGETCAVPGVYPVTGTQMVSTPEGGVSKSEHEIIALKSGSALKLGTETASFSGTATNLMLPSGLAWLVMEGE